METAESILSVLQSQWPDECEIADQATVQRVVGAVLRNESFDHAFRSVPGGADWDALPIIKTVFEAASFIKTCIEVKKLIRTELGRKPTEKELAQAVESKEQVAPEHVRARSETVVKILVEEGDGDTQV